MKRILGSTLLLITLLTSTTQSAHADGAFCWCEPVEITLPASQWTRESVNFSYPRAVLTGYKLYVKGPNSSDYGLLDEEYGLGLANPAGVSVSIYVHSGNPKGWARYKFTNYFQSTPPFFPPVDPIISDIGICNWK